MHAVNSGELTVTSVHFMSLKCHFLNSVLIYCPYSYSLSYITVHHWQPVIFGQRCVDWPYVSSANDTFSHFHILNWWDKVVSILSLFCFVGEFAKCNIRSSPKCLFFFLTSGPAKKQNKCRSLPFLKKPFLHYYQEKTESYNRMKLHYTRNQHY